MIMLVTQMLRASTSKVVTVQTLPHQIEHATAIHETHSDGQRERDPPDEATVTLDRLPVVIGRCLRDTALGPRRADGQRYQHGEFNAWGKPAWPKGEVIDHEKLENHDHENGATRNPEINRLPMDDGMRMRGAHAAILAQHHRQPSSYLIRAVARRSFP